MFEFVRDLWNGIQRPGTAPRDPARERELARLAEIRDRYRRELISNNGEVDRDLAESIVRRMYEFTGLAGPKEFIWVDHPEDGLVAATLFARNWMTKGVATGASTGPLMGHTIRQALIASGATVETANDESLRMMGRELPSLEDACRVFRYRLGGRGLLSISREAPFAIDSWFDAFHALEEEFEIQSPEFAKRWTKEASELWVLSEAEHRYELDRLRSIGTDIIGDDNDWDWSPPYMLSGAMEAYFAAIATLQYAENFAGATNEGITLYDEYLRHCGWCFPFVDFCIMADRPEQLFDLKEIEDEPNIEARRLMIELYGFGRYLTEINARLVAKDEYGMLYRIRQRNDEDLVIVKVINSTPEPDGTFREYFLRVPPDTPTARSGVAWSFGMREDDYAPVLET